MYKIKTLFFFCYKIGPLKKKKSLTYKLKFQNKNYIYKSTYKLKFQNKNYIYKIKTLFFLLQYRTTKKGKASSHMRSTCDEASIYVKEDSPF